MTAGRHAWPAVLTGPRPPHRPARLAAAVVAVGLVVLAHVLAVGSGYRLVVVRSGSMTPTLAPGDLLVTRGCPVSDLHVGTVVSFRYSALDGGLVTHRVADVKPSGDGVITVRTRGDANSAGETWSAGAGDRVGCLVAVVPGPRPLVRGDPVPTALALAVLVVVGVGTGAVLRRVWRRP